MRIPYGVLDGRYINSAGDSMAGQLILSGDPSSDLHAATKRYVDNADSQFLKINGSIPLTSDWDAGDFEIRAKTLQSDVATGTPPLVVTSTSKVSNLNADQADGYDFDQGVLTSSTPRFSRLGLGKSSEDNNILSILSNSNALDNKAVDIEHNGAVTGTGYGIRVSKTGASTINVGADFSASGGTLNYGLIVSSGYAGIGTSTPDRRLDILDSVSPQLRLAHTNSTKYTDFQTDNSGDLIITPTGNDVKLPNCLLTINGPYRSSYGHLCINGTTGNHAYQTIYYNNTFMGWYGLVSNSFGFCMYNGGGGGNMIFYSRASQGESARFDVNGNFGIGTINPGRKLDVLNSSAPQMRLTHTDDSIYTDFRSLSDGNLSINPSGGCIYIGSNSVNNSGTFVLDRNIASGTGNFRGFRDETSFSRTGMAAYCCFDAEASLNGGYDYDHIVGFQSRPRHTSSGTLSQLAGFSSVLYSNGGTVGSASGVRIWDVQGTGPITNNYGVYVNSLTRGTNNYAIYTAGNTRSYFGGDLGVGVIPTYMLHIAGVCDSSARGPLYIQQNSGTLGVGFTLDATYSTGGGSYSFIATGTGASGGAGDFAVFKSNSPTGYVFRVNANGQYIAARNFFTYLGQITVSPYNASTKGIVIRGANSQTANLLELQNSTGTILDIIDASGALGINTTNPGRKIDILDTSDPQLRLTHTDNSVYTDFQTTSDGGLRISPSGNKLGFFGVTPAARPATYTTSNVTTDRIYNADATTLDEIADVLGTLINDLKSYGLLQ